MRRAASKLPSPHTVGIALCALALLLACASAVAAPALWVARGPAATVYLFGTVHVLPAGSVWHDPVLDQALAASDKLIVEEHDDDPLKMQGLVLQYGLDPQHPLSAQLDARDRQRLDAAAADLGLPGGAAALNAMKPWLAALTLTVAPIVKAGMDPQSGVDKQLQADFKARGKPISALETSEQQIRIFDGLPGALQLDLLREVLTNYSKGPAELTRVIHAWQAGDVAAITAAMNSDMHQQSPQLYQALLVNRNRDWARQISALLQQRGTVFIAVGAGHLAGPDSVQAQLQTLGISTTRVQ